MPPEGPERAEAEALDSDTEALWGQLQQALATKRELQRKLATAENVARLWERHRGAVQALASSHGPGGAAAAIDGAQQLTSTLQQGWHLLRTAEGAGAAAGAAGDDATATGPRGLQQRFTQRRAEINTVSVPDLGLLSSLICSS